ncbi:MAG TPA: hypothetical protein VFP32_00890 [Candidatus Saccharimonadales bacterium]|nr:hypothetical protein [Candidatus Saccharimonadales bacterium]
MNQLEALNNAPEVPKIDTSKYWEVLEPLLTERGVSALDHIRKAVEEAEDSIWQMPDYIFDPRYGEGLPLRQTHVLLATILESDQPFAQEVAKAIFPYWRGQLEDADDFARTSNG